MRSQNGSDRGSSTTRRERRRWAMLAWGDGESVRCAHCGALLDRRTLTLDRIISGILGGTYRRENLQPSCRSCNCRAGARLRWLRASR